MPIEMFLNRITEKWLNAYINRPSAALFIDAPDDSTFGFNISRQIHSSLVTNPKSPLIILNEGDNKSIGIDDVRSLQKSLTLSANRSIGISRIAVITKTELLTHEAQNALLKLIEELPERTLLILVCSNKEKVLDTVISRCFLLPVLPIEEPRALEYADKLNVEPKEAAKAYSLSEGRNTVFMSLIQNEDNELVQEIDLAKDFIKATVFDRQKVLKKVLEKDHNVPLFLQSLKVITKSGMRNAKDLKQKNRWKSSLQAVLLAESQIKSNVSAKLVLLSLSVSA